MKLGIVVSNAAAARSTHTTVHLVEGALARGHAVRLFEPWDFEISPAGRLEGRAHAFDHALSREDIVATLEARTSLRRSIDLPSLDFVLLRANPLQDAILTFGLFAQAAGVEVLNEPRGMMRTCHKGYVATLPGVPRPRTLLTRSLSAAERFLTTCEAGAVIKPARSCGGRGVTLLRGRRGRRNLPEALHAASGSSGDGYAVVQEYLPAASSGEKRLLWLEGELIGGYLRQRAPDDFRHNLKVGGIPEPAELTAADHALAATLTPALRTDGVWFAGIDVIGGLVVEVNTLNPGGAHHTAAFTGLPIGERLIRSLEARRGIHPPGGISVPR